MTSKTSSTIWFNNVQLESYGYLHDQLASWSYKPLNDYTRVVQDVF